MGGAGDKPQAESVRISGTKRQKYSSGLPKWLKIQGQNYRKKRITEKLTPKSAYEFLSNH